MIASVKFVQGRRTKLVTDHPSNINPIIQEITVY